MTAKVVRMRVWGTEPVDMGHPLKPLPLINLRDVVEVQGVGSGSVVARSFGRPFRYDVEMADGKVLRDVTEDLVRRKP